MASELSNYLANSILGWFGGAAMPAAPAQIYVGLFNGDPTPAGNGGNEVTTTVRAAGRVAVPLAPTAGRNRNSSADVNFGVAAGGTNVTHAAIFDAAAGGNMLTYTPLDNNRAIASGDPVVIPLGDLSINFN